MDGRQIGRLAGDLDRFLRLVDAFLAAVRRLLRAERRARASSAIRAGSTLKHSPQMRRAHGGRFGRGPENIAGFSDDAYVGLAACVGSLAGVGGPISLVRRVDRSDRRESP